MGRFQPGYGIELIQMPVHRLWSIQSSFLASFRDSFSVSIVIRKWMGVMVTLIKIENSN